jgi:SAM-dependent methyltransferase
MCPWYDRAFGPWYLRLYPHRNREEAERAVRTIEPWLRRGGRVLDVGCGAGRHLELLDERGFAVTGLDRSAVLLRELAGRSRLGGRVVRGDMRLLPFSPQAFASLLCMFTSFGYFGSRQAHQELLGEFARVTEPRGTLVLDYLNVPEVENRLLPASERTIEEHRVEEKRSILPEGDGRVIVKAVTIRSPAGEIVERYEERVSLYAREELLDLLARGGWREAASLGDYEGRPWGAGSDRLIVLAEREETR